MKIRKAFYIFFSLGIVAILDSCGSEQPSSESCEESSCIDECQEQGHENGSCSENTCQCSDPSGDADVNDDADVSDDGDDDSDTDADDEPNPECEDGPCCDGGTFLPSSTQCSSTAELTECRCSSDECGAAVECRDQYRYCTGDSADCGTDNLLWTDWSTEEQCSVGLYSSLALNSRDNPHISYMDNSNYDLKYGYFLFNCE